MKSIINQIIHTCDGDNLTDEQAKQAFCLEDDEPVLQVYYVKTAKGARYISQMS